MSNSKIYQAIKVNNPEVLMTGDSKKGLVKGQGTIYNKKAKINSIIDVIKDGFYDLCVRMLK